MSAISLKSITGITSITTPAGVDNVFTVHSNDTTERFRVDSNGNQVIAGILTVTQDIDVDGHTNLDNVSIAGVTTITSSASSALYVAGTTVLGNNTNLPTFNAATQLAVADLSGNNNFVDLTILGGRTGRSQVKFGDQDNKETGSIQYFHSDNSINFFTNASATRKLVIASTGNVGIGTDNPLNLLDLYQSYGRQRFNRYGHYIAKNNSASTTEYWTFAPRNGGSLGIGRGVPDVEGTVSIVNDKLTITSAGKVGIGTNNPLQKLHVADSTSANIYIETKNGTTGSTAGIYYKTSSSTASDFFKTGIVLEDDNTSYARGKLHILQNNTADGSNATLSDSVVTFTQDGKVGIGTNNPTYPLEVWDSDARLRLVDTDLASNRSIQLRNNQGSAILSAATHTSFYNSGVETVRIKSDGTVYTVTQNKRFGIGQDPDATTMGATSGTWQVPEVDGQTIGSELRIGDINTGSTAVIRLASYGAGDQGVGGGAIMFTNTRNGSASYHSDIAAIKGARESLGKGYLRFFTANQGANAEKLRITSEGKVGINATSPTRNLQIGDGTVDSNNVLRFGRRVASNESNLPLIGHHSHNGSSSSLALSATSTSGCIHFFTGNDADGFGDGNNEERLRIDSSGNVMFGTTSSTVYDDSSGSGVVIRGATGAVDIMRNNDHPLLLNRTGGDGEMIMFHRDGVNKSAISLKGGDLCFDMPSGTERLRINNTGEVGINQTNPEALLDIGGDTDGNVQASFTRAADTNFRIQFRNESSSNNVGESQGKFGLFYASNSADICGMQFNRGSSTGAGSLTFTTGGTERLRITSGGDTELRNTAASISNTYSQYLKFRTTQTNDQSAVTGQIAAQGKSNWGGELVFSTKPANGTPNDSVSERLRIDSSGNVTFTGTTGNSSPRFTIKHSNADVVGEVIRIARTDLPTIRYHSIKARHSGSAATNYISVNVHDGGASPYTSQREVARFLGSGGITFNGDTAAANALDDYEEGSYIPTVSFSGTTYTYGASNDYTLRSPHSTSNSNSISYTKIGSRVFVNFAIFWNSAVTARYVITLPFTFRGSAYQLSMTPAFYRVEIGGDCLGTLGSGSAAFDTYRTTKDTSNAGHSNIPLNVSSEVYYMICYETTE